MKLRFRSEALKLLETTDSQDFAEVADRYRSRINLIRNAPDERDFYALKSLHFEKLSGDRAGQYSMRLNLKWRLIVEFEGEAPEKTVVIAEIVDYH